MRVMEEHLRNFFDRMLEALGTVSVSDRQKAIEQLEGKMMERGLEHVLKTLRAPERKRYTAFIKKEQPTATGIADFLYSLVPEDRAVQCFAQAAQEVAKESITLLLERASDAQKERVKEVLKEYVPDLIPGV